MNKIKTEITSLILRPERGWKINKGTGTNEIATIEDLMNGKFLTACDGQTARSFSYYVVGNASSVDDIENDLVEDKRNMYVTRGMLAGNEENPVIQNRYSDSSSTRSTDRIRLRPQFYVTGSYSLDQLVKYSDIKENQKIDNTMRIYLRVDYNPTITKVIGYGYHSNSSAAITGVLKYNITTKNEGGSISSTGIIDIGSNFIIRNKDYGYNKSYLSGNGLSWMGSIDYGKTRIGSIVNIGNSYEFSFFVVYNYTGSTSNPGKEEISDVRES